MITVLALVAPSLWYEPAITPAFKTASKTFNIERASQKPLEIRLTYPTKKGRYPAFVWSHGMYGSANAYAPLVQSVAGAGYVVIQPTHADSLKYMTPDQRQNLIRNRQANNTANWRERPGEISFCIDQIPFFEKEIADLKIDTSNIAVGGHSYGAWTTQCSAAMTLSALGREVNLEEKRAKSFVVLSPHGVDGLATKEGISNMRGPMILISGSKDDSPRGQKAEWRKLAFEYASPGSKTQVWIEGADHGFGGISGPNTNRAGTRFLEQMGFRPAHNDEHLKIVLSSILAFLDSTLKGDRNASSYVTKEKLGSIKGVTVTKK